ncbi:MAG: hypothetical protein AAF556_04280 [Pseudomonadota bacterium]
MVEPGADGPDAKPPEAKPPEANPQEAGRGDGFARLIGEPLEGYLSLNRRLAETAGALTSAPCWYGLLFPLSWMVYWRLYQPALMVWLTLFALYYVGEWLVPSGQLFGMPVGIEMFEGDGPILLHTDLIKLAVCITVGLYGRSWLIGKIAEDHGVRQAGVLLDHILLNALRGRRKSSLLGYIATVAVALVEVLTWIGLLLLIYAGINGPFAGAVTPVISG